MKRNFFKKIVRKNIFKREQDRFSYQKKYIDFDIKKGERVLDIGSGNYPFPLATHLAGLEKPPIKDKRPFIECNIENTPFKNQEFDFVYCSHTLEHVDHPARACEEIMRVGKRGYIETPTRSSDIILNVGHLSEHKWYVNSVGNSLIFIPWTKLRDTGINYFFQKLRSRFNNPLKSLIQNNRDLFNNMFLWEKRFNYYVFDKKGYLISSKKDA